MLQLCCINGTIDQDSEITECISLFPVVRLMSVIVEHNAFLNHLQKCYSLQNSKI